MDLVNFYVNEKIKEVLPDRLTTWRAEVKRLTDELLSLNLDGWDLQDAINKLVNLQIQRDEAAILAAYYAKQVRKCKPRKP